MNNKTSFLKIGHLDRFGAFASMACAVHCIVLPFVLTILPIFGLGLLADHTFEKYVVVFAVLLGLFSLCWGTHLHGKKHLIWFLVLAAIFFILAHTYAEHDGQFGFQHYLFMAIGGFSLALGHILNLRLCKSCHKCTHC